MMPQLQPLFLAYCGTVVLIYWLIPLRFRTAFLAIASSGFLAFLDTISFIVLALFILLIHSYTRKRESGSLFTICLAAPFMLFCGIRTFQLLHRSGYAVPAVVLVGFGFYALKLIHYAVETRAGTFRAHSFLEFYTYMLFFPTILIGPIHLFDDFLKSERRIRWNEGMFASGLERILYGYVKVIVLANWLVSERLDAIAATLEPGTISVFIDSTLHGFHLYFAFAGYSDIAIGVALLLGYNINENFNHPFLKRNIGEFWQSWHMSLSGWCRKYVFLPIYAQWRTLSIALIGTMLAIALWHEFSIRFFLWGVYHGCGLLVWRIYAKFANQKLPKAEGVVRKGLSRSVSVVVTFLFVMIGFTIPRSESLKEMIRNFQILFGIL
jgi:alginate O-acetyltransferase complex protein AlgI